VFILFERAGNATDPQENARSNLRRDLTASHHVRRPMLARAATNTPGWSGTCSVSAGHLGFREMQVDVHRVPGLNRY
jgi:hypothetical protein